jgi:hypothetical protein
MPLPPPTSEKRTATSSPRPDVPVKEEEPEEDDDDPDLVEAKALEVSVTQLKAFDVIKCWDLQAQLKAIREKISKKGNPAKKIKLESSYAASSITVPRPGEVIDLT